MALTLAIYITNKAAPDSGAADVSRAGEEIAHVAGIHGAHGGSIARDAGNLHQAADGVAGQAQMVPH